MSLGANLSSGYTDTLTETTQRCGVISRTYSDSCSKSYISGTAVNSSIALLAKTCPSELTPAQIALYPKVAVPSSVRTESLTRPVCNNTNRFSHYNRFQPAAPCLPLAQSANMAGKSQPSSRACNL